MKTTHYFIILVITLSTALFVNSVNAYATCIIVNGTQECAGSPPILTSIKFNNTLYENSDKPVITITGTPYALVHLEIYDQSGNIVFSHNMEIQTTGTINYTLDISSYKLGVYSAIVNTSANKVTTHFTIGRMPSGPPIALNALKNMYIPGDSITILGVEGPNGIIQLSLVDPNGNVVKSVQTNANNTGQFSSNDLKIPTNAISGIWEINATHGVASYSSLEIKVSSTASMDLSKNNTNTTISTHGEGGQIIMTPTESPLKQLKSGVNEKDVICKQGLQLIIKAEDGTPACVKPDTAQILIIRGWAVYGISHGGPTTTS